MGLSRLTTVSDLAKALGVSAKTVRKWVAKRGLPHIRDGSSIWLRPEAVEAWLAEHTIVSSSPRKQNRPVL
jgi:excisionase family DNA binding protein